MSESRHFELATQKGSYKLDKRLSSDHAHLACVGHAGDVTQRPFLSLVNAR